MTEAKSERQPRFPAIILPQKIACDLVEALVKALCTRCLDRDLCATWAVYSPEEI